jgi:hypothetical protein
MALRFCVSTPAISALLFSLILLLSGCNSEDKPLPMFSVGEPAPTGHLTYTVRSTEWLNQIGEAPTIKTPQNRFLAVRISVTNGSMQETLLPSLKLMGGGFDDTAEIDASGLPEWLGTIRRVGPAMTRTGFVVFDVPRNSYRLKVSDSEFDDEKAVLIDIPLQLDSGSQLAR